MRTHLETSKKNFYELRISTGKRRKLPDFEKFEILRVQIDPFRRNLKSGNVSIN